LCGPPKIKINDAWDISPYPLYKCMCHIYKRIHVDTKNDGQKALKF
jgi:hypothetical protein